jgi:hypothetical protein
MAVAPSPLQELTDAARGAEALRLDSEFDLPGGKVLHASLDSRQRTTDVNLRETRGPSSQWKPAGTAAGLDDAFRQVAATYPTAVLRPDSIELRVSKGSTTAARLLPVVIRAWHEAFGRPIPPLDEVVKALKASRAAARAAEASARATEKTEAEETLALLKGGPKGVDRFNDLPSDRRSQVDLTKADLAGCDLSYVALVRGTRLNEARLTGARLKKAKLAGCRCSGADFSRADLTWLTAWAAHFQGASFAGADLTNADLSRSDLRGVDLTGATLTECTLFASTFDEGTRWPRGFRLPDHLIWKGQGADPRRAPSASERAKPKPTDFAEFLTRLEQATDMAKFAKAMAMLRAERFRLFARVEPDGVIGVVKSQSDPDLVYSCRLGADGKYACCTQNLNFCGGLRGSPCKHLLVLVVGLTRAGELDPAAAHDWTQASRGRKPELDRDAMAATLLKYKGAEAGEVDWRPTETIPEDFYAM